MEEHEQKQAIWIGPEGNNTRVGNTYRGRELTLDNETYCQLLSEKLIKPAKAKEIKEVKKKIIGGN